MGRMGLSLDVLGTLERGPATSKQIAKRLGKSRAACYIVLERHRLGGRVVRERVSPSVRDFVYSLTPSGEKRLRWSRRAVE